MAEKKVDECEREPSRKKTKILNLNMLNGFIKLTERAEMGNNSLWVVQYKKHLSHYT